MNSNNHKSRMIESDPTVIQAELDRVLGERRFSGAPQMSAFLRYIVTETLNGHADRIKAFSVGVDALGKPDTFDAQTDPSVRVLALRLRKTLSAMYENQDDCLAVIDLQVGTYVPNFYKPEKSMPATSPAGQATEAVPAASRSAERVPELVPDRVPDRVPERIPERIPENVVPDREPIRETVTQASDSRTTSDSAEIVACHAPRAEAVAYTSGQPERPGVHHGHTVRRATEGMTLNGLLGSKIAIFGGAVLLAAVWQAGLSKVGSDGAMGGIASVGLPVMNASSSTWMSAGNAVVEPPAMPTIYLDAGSGDQALERRIVMMLSSRFISSGTVNVVNGAAGASATPRAAGGYQLMVSGYTVDSDTQVIAQLVRLADGELLFADTLMLGGSPDSFTTQGIGAIDAMASNIVSDGGPLYDDFCIRFSDAPQTCPVS